MTSASETANLTQWKGQSPFYEVYYVKWNDPAQNVAGWIRYTLLASTTRPPEVSTWGIFFDSRDPSKNIALKNTFPLVGKTIGPETFSSGPSVLSSTSAQGILEDVAHRLRWSLKFEEPSLALLPYPKPLYALGFPKTKFVIPRLSMKISGTLDVDGRVYSFAKVPGHEGHLWGKIMSPGWSWANGNAFGNNDFCFEALSSGPFTILFLKWRGHLYRMNGPMDWIRNRSVSSLDGWQFTGTSGDYIFKGNIRASYDQMVGVRYEDPSGSSRFCHNTKTADATIQVFQRRKGSPLLVETFTSEKTTAFEYVTGAHDPRVRLMLP